MGYFRLNSITNSNCCSFKRQTRMEIALGSVCLQSATLHTLTRSLASPSAGAENGERMCEVERKTKKLLINDNSNELRGRQSNEKR